MLMGSRLSERSTLLGASIVIALLLFTAFHVIPPFSSPSLASELLIMGGMSGTELLVTTLEVRVVHVKDGIETPARGMIVQVDGITSLTNRFGIARFFLVPGMYAVSVISRSNTLPTWSGEIQVSGSSTILTLRYVEERVNPKSVKMELDFQRSSTRVTLQTELPSYSPKDPANIIFYVGSPTIFYLDSEFREGAFVNGIKYDPLVEDSTSFGRRFVSIPPPSPNSVYTFTEEVLDVVRLVLPSETYVPVFAIEVEITRW